MSNYLLFPNFSPKRFPELSIAKTAIQPPSSCSSAPEPGALSTHRVWQPCPEGFGAGRRWFPAGIFHGGGRGGGREEDNGQRNDGRVKKHLFRCQGQKALPGSGARKWSPRGKERGRERRWCSGGWMQWGRSGAGSAWMALPF